MKQEYRAYSIALIVFVLLVIGLYKLPKNSIYQKIDIPQEALTKHEVIKLAKKVARERGISEELFIKVMMRESNASTTIKGDMDIICRNINSPYYGKPVEARGLFQITQCYFWTVPDSCAYDALCSINWAADRFKEGKIELFNSWNYK